MRRPDAAKRSLIIDTAAQLFANRTFHEVRLEDVAQEAHVGKGTIYIYFRSKEELYGALLLEGFSQLVDRLRDRMREEQGTPRETLSMIVHELVNWAKSAPHFFTLMPPGDLRPPVAGLREKRRELGRMIEETIARGVARGDFHDPRPDLTAQFIPGCVRAVLRHGPSEASGPEIAEQILRVIGGGIFNGGGAGAARS